VGEEPQNFLWFSVRGDVVIRGLAVEKDVTDATADEEGLVAVALKRGANRVGEFAGIHGMIMRQRGELNEVEEIWEVNERSGAAEDSEMVRVRSSGGLGM
jgi:hypothetical protein